MGVCEERICITRTLAAFMQTRTTHLIWQGATEEGPSVGSARKIRDKQIHKPLRRLRLGTNVSEFQRRLIALSRRGKSPSQLTEIA